MCIEVSLPLVIDLKGKTKTGRQKQFILNLNNYRNANRFDQFTTGVDNFKAFQLKPT